ncbi:MAG: rhodanese-like domain-containing protein [Campylobacterota bacterium]
MKILNKIIVATAISSLCASLSFAEGSSNYVPISNGVKSIEMNLNGVEFTLKRNQESGNKINELYNNTTVGAPQPIKIAKGVETLGELEFIDYMKKAQTDNSIVVADSRTPGWHAKLRIPGTINLPYTNFQSKENAIEAMEFELGVVLKEDGTLDFSKAKTLVAYCNGYWCGQTPAMVKNVKYSLLNLGYPASKIKYYRGGMQAWTSLGFTTVGSAK